MEAVGRLAGGIAHDFNNLLTVMLSGLAVLEQNASRDERELLRQLVDISERAAALTSQLLAFSRREPVHRSPLELRVIAGNVSRLLQTMLRQKTRLEMDLGSREAPACANANMIEQVLMNLVINARDAMPQGGRIVLRLEASIDVDRILPAGGKTGGVFHRGGSLAQRGKLKGEARRLRPRAGTISPCDRGRSSARSAAQIRCLRPLGGAVYRRPPSLTRTTATRYEARAA